MEVIAGLKSTRWDAWLYDYEGWLEIQVLPANLCSPVAARVVMKCPVTRAKLQAMERSLAGQLRAS